MKLTCPKCNAEIPSSGINIKEGIANCAHCNELFKIAQFLKDDEELRRIKKPHYSKVELSESKDGWIVKIPPSGWSGTTFFMLLFALVWGFAWVLILFNETPNKYIAVSSLILLDIVFWGMMLFTIKGTVQLKIDASVTQVRWSLFGVGYGKKRMTKNLEKITQDVLYTKNDNPVYGIGLFFNNEGKVKFGSMLKEEERKWLIGELYEIKEKYALKRPKNNSTPHPVNY